MGRALDLTGKIFGKLRVLSRTNDKEKEKKKKSSVWICECECGNIIEIEGSRLKRLTRSCGCVSAVFKDLTGQHFGRLTVLRRGITSDISKKIYWVCLCECGEVVEAQGNALSSGSMHSCGCLKSEITSDRFISKDIIGKRFTRLTVLDIGYRQNKKIFWKCLCDCGKVVFVGTGNLKTGDTKSCGCFNIDCVRARNGENHPNWKGGTTPLQQYLRCNIDVWKIDSANAYNNRCVISGKSAEVIHHLYPFYKILEETLIEVNLTFKNKLEEYTDEDLMLIKQTLLEKHYEYPLGVCLINEIHKEFHSTYGYNGFSLEDFQEFYLLKTGKHLELKSMKKGDYKYAI